MKKHTCSLKYKCLSAGVKSSNGSGMPDNELNNWNNDL